MGRTRLLTTLAAVVAMAGSGCASLSDGAAAGTVIGGLAGAGIGRAIGHHNGGNEAQGGWVGAGLGAVMGGLAGDIIDRESRRETVPTVDLGPDGRVPYVPPPPRAKLEEPAYRSPRRIIVREDPALPPIPQPATGRYVRRTTTTTTTTVRRTCPPGFIVIEE